MKLSNEQIKSIIQGAVYFSEEEKGLQPHRMNKEEEAFYLSDKFAKKEFASSSMQTIFKTDGDKLILKANVSEGSTRKYFSFDVYVNGEIAYELNNYAHLKMTPRYTKKECMLGDFSWELPLETGDKEIRIVFPFGSKVIISEFTLDNATYVEPVKRSKTMLIYGDSITQGYDALNPSRAYAVRLAHELDAEAFNKAIGGEMFQPELAHIKNDICPDYITVAYGTNDWSHRTKEEFQTNCRDFYKNLKGNYPDTKIFALLPIWRADTDNETPFGEFTDVHKMITKICEEIGGITIIDGYKLVPHEKTCFGDFYLHPSNEGFDHYAKNLIAEIKKYI